MCGRRLLLCGIFSSLSLISAEKLTTKGCSNFFAAERPSLTAHFIGTYGYPARDRSFTGTKTKMQDSVAAGGSWHPRAGFRVLRQPVLLIRLPGIFRESLPVEAAKPCSASVDRGV